MFLIQERKPEEETSNERGRYEGHGEIQLLSDSVKEKAFENDAEGKEEYCLNCFNQLQFDVIYHIYINH